MGKTHKVSLSKEDLHDLHEFKKKRKRESEELLKQIWKDQLDELRSAGLREEKICLTPILNNEEKQ